MRRRWLVAYDVSDAKALKRVHRLLDGHGDALQYSVFVCDLTVSERQLLLERLLRLVNLTTDRLMFVDLGASDGGSPPVEFHGAGAGTFEARLRAVII